MLDIMTALGSWGMTGNSSGIDLHSIRGVMGVEKWAWFKSR